MVDGSSFIKQNNGRMTYKIKDTSPTIYRTIIENGTNVVTLKSSLTSICIDQQQRNVIDRLKTYGKELLLVNVGAHWITILVECFFNSKNKRRIALWLADSSSEQTKEFGPMEMYGHIISGLANTLENHLVKVSFQKI